MSSEFNDVRTLLEETTWIRLSGDTTLDDLRQGPSILIGGLDNAWTLRAVAALRYRFDADQQYECWISDRNNLQSRSWLLDLKKPYGAVSQDYAILPAYTTSKQGSRRLSWRVLA